MSQATPGLGRFRLTRTCYDHLAGLLGVWVHDRLAEGGAIEVAAEAREDIGLTPALDGALHRLGLGAPPPSKTRRAAYACRDLTERRFHIGGALGAHLCGHMITNGWLDRVEGTRALRLTDLGRAELARRLGPLPSDLAA